LFIVVILLVVSIQPVLAASAKTSQSHKEKGGKAVEGAARQKWTLTQDAFDALLGALDPDRDTAAARYLEIRRNLVRLFEWRGCSTPDDDADETMNRCARKIAQGEEIRDLASYSVGVARMLLREKGRGREREGVPLDQAPEPYTAPRDPAVGDDEHVNCLRQCLAQLSPETRDLVLSYYHGEKGEKIKHRKGLRQLFGISATTLRMRALRVRERLQLCAEGCLKGRLENAL
jgi:DNA-directed RNA polymerase specialized sigma24 family protein